MDESLNFMWFDPGNLIDSKNQLFKSFEKKMADLLYEF